MTSQNSSPFFSRPPVTRHDSPLSPAGRFSRLSYIGWYGLLHLSIFLLAIAFSLTLGIISLNNGVLNENFTNALNGMAGLGFLLLFVVYFYFHLVLVIRRLHDLNQTGWISLLLLVPVINFFLAFYLLLAPGTPGMNRYGPPRVTSAAEKIMAWLIIILSILSLLSMGSMMSYMMGSGELQTPSEMMRQSSKYF
ncbi:DUF805 domain-containing protein [Acinetobacter sp. CAAS 2-6]|uniref:DUF805 domain-containing protein n=1 Tax=Acinetobacter sp. CAAS 2-6 TaxID=3016358 RepID=UPI002DD65786|nr:DUF805 domain-containing protein [Acinetobacter sp. CAAS 2-6]